MFNEKDSLETVVLTFDFTNELLGETISGTTGISVSVISGIDANPSAILTGPVGVSGGLVMQGVRAGLPGVTYNVKAVVNTSGARILVRNDYLPVVAA